MAKHGHEVSAAVEEPLCREALKGIVNQVEEFPSPEDFDLCVFDVTGSGKDADEIRLLTPTIGDSVLADTLEEDRVYALDFMQRCGIQVPPWERFNNPAQAIRYIKKQNKPMVFKPVGDQQDKSTTYVASSPEDMLRYFDVLFRSNPQKEFVLQEVVKGTEVSTEVYINETGYYALNQTLECKKLMNKNVGPNTGCSGALVWMSQQDNPIFDKGLKKAVKPLQEMGYVGPIDLNTIVNDAGVWGLEFCARFGYDATALLIKLIPIDFAEFLYAIAANKRPPDLTPKHSFCATTRLSIPPYPCEGLPRKFYKAGVPIEGLTEKNLDKFFIYDVRKRSEEADDLESAGICGWIGGPLAVGETIGETFRGVEEMIKAVKIPNCQHRTDILENTARRYIELKEGGWLRPTFGDSE
jgi:phosphoribosylamine---glycine ligase